MDLPLFCCLVAELMMTKIATKVEGRQLAVWRILRSGKQRQLVAFGALLSLLVLLLLLPLLLPQLVLGRMKCAPKWSAFCALCSLLSVLSVRWSLRAACWTKLAELNTAIGEQRKQLTTWGETGASLALLHHCLLLLRNRLFWANSGPWHFSGAKLGAREVQRSAHLHSAESLFRFLFGAPKHQQATRSNKQRAAGDSEQEEKKKKKKAASGASSSVWMVRNWDGWWLVGDWLASWRFGRAPKCNCRWRNRCDQKQSAAFISVSVCWS